MRRIIFVYLLLIFVSTPHTLLGWSNSSGGDHEGVDWIIDSNIEVAGKHFNIGKFYIVENVVVSVKGSTIVTSPWVDNNYGFFEVNASTIVIDGILTASGKGFQGGSKGNCQNASGPGAGLLGRDGGGGGGGSYGGVGGRGGGQYGGAGGEGGATYGSDIFTYPPSSDDIDFGSGGAGSNRMDPCSWPFNGVGGAGGGKIILIASNIAIKGLIEADGKPGGKNYTSGGGGSGGGVLIKGKSLAISSITANGGDGAVNGSGYVGGGGGGGGGRVKIFFESISIGTISVNGGDRGDNISVNGGSGSIYIHDCNMVSCNLIEPPTLVSPSSYSEVGFTTVLDWYDVSGAVISYQVQVASNSIFSSTFISSNTLESNISLSMPHTSPINYWRVRAYDGQYYTDWSNVWTLHFDTIPPHGFGISSIIPYISSATIKPSAPIDNKSGIHLKPYVVEASSSSSFETISFRSGWQQDQSLTIIGLQPNTSYWYRLKVRDFALNESTYSLPMAKISLANYPSGLSVISASASSITISWSYDSPDNPSWTKYIVELSSSQFLAGEVLHSSITYKGVGEATIDGLLQNTTYNIRIIAFNLDGINTTATVFSSSTLLSSPPINLCAPLLGSTSVQIVWQDNNNPAAPLYNVQISSSSSFDPLISSITAKLYAEFFNLQPNTFYKYRVAGLNWNNRENFTSILSTTTYSNPPSVGGFNNIIDSSIGVSWGSNSNPSSTEYHVEISKTEDFLAVEHSSPWQTSLSYIFTDLAYNTPYYFRVKSRNTLGIESEFSYLGISKTLLSYPNTHLTDDYDHRGEDWIISEPVTIAGKHINIGKFVINEGITVSVEPSTSSISGARFGKVEIYASTIAIYGLLSANRSGFGGGGEADCLRGGANGNGPGGGLGGEYSKPIWGGAGGGGGYGGNGGTGSKWTAGGNLYGVDGLVSSPPSSDDIQLGSGGGSGTGAGSYNFSGCRGGRGGAGGGAIVLVGSSVTLNKVSADGGGGYTLLNGWDTNFHAGGGGSGGTILIDAYDLNVSSCLSVRGGDGGRGAMGSTRNGGSGSGGRIKIFYGIKNNVLAFADPGEISLSISPDGNNSKGSIGTIHYNHKSSIVSLIEPNEGSHELSLPNLRWSNSVDSDGPDNDDSNNDSTSISYEIRFSTNPHFNPILSQTSILQNSFVSTASLVGSDTYYWQIRSFDQQSYSDWSSYSHYLYDKSAPSDYGFKTVGSHISSFTINLHSAVDSLIGLNSFPYQIDISSSPLFDWITASSGWIGGAGWDVNGLMPSTTYYLRVKARDAAFNESVYVQTSRVTLANQPKNIAVRTLGTSSVTVSWAASSPDNPLNNKYLVQFSSANFDSNSPYYSSQTVRSANNATVSSLLPNTTYSIRVIAINWDHEATSSTLISTATLTTSPINLRASILGSTSAVISWASDNPEGTLFHLQLSKSKDFAFINSSSVTTLNQATLTSGVESNTTYYYRVSGRNWHGINTFSESYEAVTLANPPLRKNFGEVNSNSIITQWDTHNNPDGTHYQVQMATSSDFAIIQDTSPWQTLTSYSFGSLSNNTSYWFRVKARNHQQQESGHTLLGTIPTLAVTPQEPIVSTGYDDNFGLGYFSRVLPFYGDNHPDTQIAIQNMDSGQYLQGNGTTGPNPVWMNKSNWELGFVRSAEGGLSGLTPYNYRAYVRNFSNLINNTPTRVSNNTTPPTQPNAPTIEEVNDTSLKITINYVPGGERYWVSYATWIAAPVSQYISVGTITPSESTITDDFDGGTPDVSLVSLPSLTTDQITLSWAVPSIPASEPRYYRFAAVDNMNRTGQKSGIGVGASKVTPAVLKYAIYRNDLFLTSTTANNYLDKNLTPNTSYQYKIIAISNENKSGNASLSNVQYTYAEDPRMSIAGPVSNNSIKVLFSTGQNPSYTEYALFNVEGNGYVRTDGSLQAAATYFSLAGGDSGRLHNGLGPNLSYTYKVKGRNLAGQETLFSPVSNPIFTLPDIPLVKSINHSTHAWSNALTTKFTASRADHFHYILNQSSDIYPTSSDTQWDGSSLNLNLTSDGTWYFHVLGDNSQHQNSGVVHFGPILIDTTPPVGVGIDSLIPNTSQQITLVASIPSDLQSGTSAYYFEEVSGNPGGSSSDQWSSNRSFIDSGLKPNHLYSYHVRSIDSAGNISSNSLILSTYTHASVPVFVSNAKVSGLGLNIDWGNGGNPVGTLYELVFSTYSDFNFVHVVTATLTQSATVQNLVDNSVYYVRGRSKNQRGVYTAYSSLGSKLTGISTIPINPTPNVYTTSATVSWSQGSNPSDAQYIVEASSGSSFDQEMTKNSGWVSRYSADFNSLVPNTSYYFRIKSRNSNLDESPYHSFDPSPLLAVVPSVSQEDLPVAVSSNSLKFTWGRGNNPKDTEFKVELSKNNDFGSIVSESLWTNSTYYVSAFLDPDTVYWARVRSRNRRGIETDPISISSKSTLSPTANIVSLLPINSWTSSSIASFTASGSDHYHIKFSTNPNESPTTNDTQWNGNLLELPIPFDGDWYLHVRSDNNEHENSGLSNIGAIRRDKSSPTIPIPTSPAQDAVVRLNNTEFDWNQSIDSNPVVYLLEVSTSSDFTSLSIKKSGLTTNRYVPSVSESLTDGVTYFWRLKASDSLKNVSSYSLTQSFYTDLIDLEFVGIETYDSDGDGFGDSIRLIFNQNVMASSFDPADFQIFMPQLTEPSQRFSSAQKQNEVLPRAPQMQVGTPLPKNVGDGNENGKVYFVSVSSFPSYIEPKVRYIGNKLKSVKGKSKPPDPEPLTAVDKIGPAIMNVGAKTNIKSNQTVIVTALSEIIPKNEASDPNRWAIESPAGTSVPLDGVKSIYDPESLTVKFVLPVALKPSNTIQISGKNLHDARGNIRDITSRSTQNIFNPFSVNSNAQNGGKLPFGSAVKPQSEVSVSFEGQLDIESLRNNIEVRMAMDHNGNQTNEIIPGNISITDNGQTGKFAPIKPLNKGSLYRVKVASAVSDIFGFNSGEEILWEFRTALDQSVKNVVEPHPGMKIVLAPGTFSEDSGLKVNLDPEKTAEHLDRNLIRRAIENERNKGHRYGSLSHYPISGMMIEIFGEKSNGEVIKGQLGNTVSLILNYPDSDNDGVLDGTNPPVLAKNLKFYHLDETLGEFVPLENSSVDTSQKTVSVNINHFSVYAVMSGVTPDFSDIRVGPNPWDPSQEPYIKIDYLKDSTIVEVYLVTGQKVASLSMNDGSGILRWDGRNDDGEILASGVYYLVVKGSDGRKVLPLTIVR